MRIAYKLPLFLIIFIAAFGIALLAFESGIIVPGIERLELDGARSD